MNDDMRLQNLMEQVQSNPKYQAIMPDLVENLSRKAIRKGLTGKAAVKNVRKKLHQVGGAYFRCSTDYTKMETDLTHLLKEIKSDEARGFCLKQMKGHTSTAERLPIIESFFKTTLASIAPIDSVLDLACGLNPLAIPWIPLAEKFTYHACDIYLDMLAFVQTFFNHFTIQGRTFPCNLESEVPQENVQVAFFLKSLPCLEQLDKTIGIRLIEKVRADHILISFPVRSLGGLNKGMPKFYHDHFYELVAGTNWTIQEFAFETELAFLVSK